jgi:hypothetical protein
MLRSSPRKKFTMPDTRVADVVKESWHTFGNTTRLAIASLAGRE